MCLVKKPYPFLPQFLTFGTAVHPGLRRGGEGVVELLYISDMDGCQKIESKPWPVINVGVVQT